MGQNGRSSRFSADEIDEIRTIDAMYRAVKLMRMELRLRLGLSRDDWHRYSRGDLGKKPRREAA